MFHNKLPRGRQGLVLDQQLNNTRTDISVVLLAHLLSWLKRLLQLQSSPRCHGRKREKTAVAITLIRKAKVSPTFRSQSSV